MVGVVLQLQTEPEVVAVEAVLLRNHQLQLFQERLILLQWVQVVEQMLQVVIHGLAQVVPF